MDNLDELEKIISIIAKNIPNDNNINILMLLFRIMPIFLVCHDWNVHYKYSITYYISYYTALPLFHQSNAKKISFYLITLFFVLAIINIVIFLKLYNQLREYNKINHPRIFKVNIHIMYFANFVLSPFIFMICTENFFCTPVYDENISYKFIKDYKDDCRNYLNILIIIIQFLLFIWNIILNVIFSTLTAKPLCFTSSLIVAKLNEIKFNLAFFPLFQMILVTDYYLPFKICTILRIFARGIYVIFYINLILHEPKNFYTNFNIRYALYLIYSMNFFSCIIEYIFLFDLKNNLEILQKNTTIMIFKILIEISLSILIIQFLNNNERKFTLQVFHGKICSDFPYELLNKIFYIFNHIEKKIGNDLLYEIIEDFDTIFKNHLKENKCLKINGLKCYCKKFTYDNFTKQVDDFLDAMKDVREGAKPVNKILKNKFPVIYKYIEYFIRVEINKNKSNTSQAFFILALVLFYIIFDKNYNKSLFYVEEFINTKFYKENRIVRLQTKLIKLVILDDYKNCFIYSPGKEDEKHTENSFPEMYKIYSKLTYKISIENNIISVMDNYINSLNQYKEKDCTLNECVEYMKVFRKSLNKMNIMLMNTYSKNPISSFHLCAKITLFYSFFYSEIPKNISICYKNIFEIECNLDSFSTLIINTYNNKNNWKFTIEYASDELCSKLGYCLYEIKGKEFNELFPESLKKCFEYIILEKIRFGSVQILLREIVLVNKEKYASLFDMIAIVIFTGDGLKLFMKVYPYNFKQARSKSNKKTKRKNSQIYNEKKKEKKKNSKEECFAFINKNGKVIAIGKEFEHYFCLNLNTLRKYKINLLKDILKIENVEGKDTIRKNLAQIYEHIAELNFSLMQNSSNEEFAKPYKEIKKFQKEILKNIQTNLICNFEDRELAKNDKKFKQYYFVCFNIEVDNKIVSFEDYLKNESITKTDLLTLQSNTKIGDLVPGMDYKKKKKTKFDLNINQNEVINKIRQIQILSIKQLILNYNINVKEILELSQEEEEEFNQYNNIVDKETTRLISNSSVNSSNTKSSTNQMISIDNLEKFFKIRMDDSFQPIKKKSNNQILKKRIYLQVFIWIFFTTVFITLQTFIIIIEREHKKKTEILTNILLNSLITRNIIYSFISSLISMQFIANYLQNDTVIDNGFINTIDYHKDKIWEKIQDFLYYYKLFERQEKYLSDYNEQEIISIFFTELDYISVKSDNLIQKESLNSILSTSHLTAYEVIKSDIEVFYFNISYDTIENRKLLNESAFFQFVFDNYFCNGKYSWDEVDNLLLNDIKHDSNQIIIYIYIINVINGMLMIIIFIFQIYFFNKITNQIYAKYYINYNYLQFFNNLLLKKASLIKDFIDNTSNENFHKIKFEKIAFINKYKDNTTFKNNYIRINNKIPMLIKAFKIQLIKNEEQSREGSITYINYNHLNPSNTLENNLKNDKKEFTIDNPSDFFTNHQNTDNIIINEKNDVKKHTLFKIVKKKQNEKKKRPLKRDSFIYKKDKDATNDNLNDINISSISNKNNYSLNLLTELNQISTKKDLQKSKQYIVYLLFFSISCISIVFFSFINDLVIQRSLKENVIFTKMIKNMMEVSNTRMEIFLMYAITLLKGEVISFIYNSHGYLNSFDELDYINKLKTHEILDEALIKNDLFVKNVYRYLEINKARFPNLNNVINLLNRKNSCDYIFKYYYDNIEEYGYEQFNPINSYNESELNKICINISNGINSQGIRTAIESLVVSIKSHYYEFKDDDYKGENLTFRINNQRFVSYQLEVEYILEKTYVLYIISWKKDNRIARNKLKKYIFIFYVLIMVLILIILFFYLIFFPFKTLKENEVINDVEPCYYNTILY